MTKISLMQRASDGRMLGLPKRSRTLGLTPKSWRRARWMRSSFESTGRSTTIVRILEIDGINIGLKMRSSSTRSSQPLRIWPASTRRPFLFHTLTSCCLTHTLSSPSELSLTSFPPLFPSSPFSLDPRRTIHSSLLYRNSKRLPCGDGHSSSRPISLSLSLSLV